MHFTYLIAHCNFLWSRIFGFRDIFQSLNLIGHCHFPESRDIFSCNILHTAYFQAAKNFVKYLVASNLPLGLIVQLSFIWSLLIAYLVERTKMHWNHESFTIFSKNSLVVKKRKKLGYQCNERRDRGKIVVCGFALALALALCFALYFCPVIFALALYFALLLEFI